MPGEHGADAVSSGLPGRGLASDDRRQRDELGRGRSRGFERDVAMQSARTPGADRAVVSGRGRSGPLDGRVTLPGD